MVYGSAEGSGEPVEGSRGQLRNQGGQLRGLGSQRKRGTKKCTETHDCPVWYHRSSAPTAAQKGGPDITV